MAEPLSIPATGAIIRLMPPEPMSVEMFNATLNELGMNATELATYLGIGRDAVSKWKRRGVPAYVAGYLNLARAAKQNGVAFERSPRPWGNVRRRRAAGLGEPAPATP